MRTLGHELDAARRERELREEAIARLERELIAAHRCVDVLGVERLLWLRNVFADRTSRLACSLETARCGWSA